MATHKVFYSWQSDRTPKTGPATNRYFILEALEDAATAIREDASIEIEPVVDRDTLGVAGSPNIADTILRKIEEASVFVCDVSIINPDSPDRKTPNPNVLLELGYALKALPLGIHQVILVMNAASGTPEQLPFDLRQYRVATYHAPRQSDGEKTERAPERRKLQATLDEALRLILARVEDETGAASVPEISLGEQARLAVEAGQPNQAALVRRYMGQLAERFRGLAPDLSSLKPDEMDEALVAALGKTTGIVAEFGRLTQAVAGTGSQEVAEVVYKDFGLILEGYDLPPGFSGVSIRVQFDFHKFVGHELFVVFVGSLIQENRWELLGSLLRECIYVRNGRGGTADLMSFDYASRPVELLDYRNRRLKLNLLSLHGKILDERHSQGELGEAVPMKQFTEADLYLYLHSALSKDTPDGWNQWYARSEVYLRDRARFLTEARSQRFALRLARAMGLDSVATFRRRFAERAYGIAEGHVRSGHFLNPYKGITAEYLGSSQ